MHDFSSCCGQQISLNTTDHRGNTKFTATFSIIFKLMVELPRTCCLLYNSRLNNVVFHSWHLIIIDLMQKKQNILCIIRKCNIITSGYYHKTLSFYNHWITNWPLCINLNIFITCYYIFISSFQIIIADIEILAWDLLLFVWSDEWR